jgi:hypothetical protein
MAGGGTLSNPCNGTVARWTPKGSGARLGPIGSRGLSLDHAQRILVRVRDLRQQAADRDRYSVRSAGSQAALCSSRVIPRSLRRFSDQASRCYRAVPVCPQSHVCGCHLGNPWSGISLGQTSGYSNMARWYGWRFTCLSWRMRSLHCTLVLVQNTNASAPQFPGGFHGCILGLVPFTCPTPPIRPITPRPAGTAHISNGPLRTHSMHTRNELTPYPRQAGPFKTHRPNCGGAVQSNPFLAHRRGVQHFFRPRAPVAASPG